MPALALRFRSLLIGIVCLLLSAGLVFAGGGFTFGAGSGGLDRAAEGPGQTVDDNDGDDSEAAPAVEDGDEDGDADNHGDLVSQAAQMDTPEPAEGAEGFKNHGAFVSCVARKLYVDPAADPAVEIVLAELTPEDCERDAEAEAEDDEAVTEDDEVVTEDEDEWDNHGDLVSDAAQMATLPDGFETRGAFVSCVAKMAYGKKGVEAPADFTLAGLTTDDCQKAEDEAEADAEATADDGPGKSDQAKAKGKGHGKGKGRGPGG